MVQDIFPKVLYNQFIPGKVAGPDAAVLLFRGKDVYIREEGGLISLPTASCFEDASGFRYLFAIDETEFFLAPEEGVGIPEGFAPRPVQEVYRYRMEPIDIAFAVFTGYQLRNWYVGNRFCGCCGGRMQHHGALRALRCEACGNMVFPKIVPAVMVAVTDGDRVLVTKYANATYDYLSLIAGFTEIGESFEDTVRREVME